MEENNTFSSSQSITNPTTYNSGYHMKFFVLDYMNKKNILYTLGTRLWDIQKAKYITQLRRALLEFLRLMGCMENNEVKSTSGDYVSQGSVNGGGSIETSSMDSRDSLSTSRKERDSTLFNYPLGVGVKSQQDFDIWTETLITQGCSFVVSPSDKQSSSRDQVNLPLLFNAIIEDSKEFQMKDKKGNLSHLGMDDWILRTQNKESQEDSDSNLYSGIDVVLVDWNEYRTQTHQKIEENITERTPRILFMTHLIQHFILLMHTKCIISYLTLTKQGTLRDKTHFLQQMNGCIALFLRIIEGLFLILADSKHEHDSFADWGSNLDLLSNLLSEEWIHENNKEWILDAIRAALLRKRIALEFIDGIGVGQVVAILRSKKSSTKLRCKCVQVICLLLKVAQLADEHDDGKYYQELVMERVGVYLGRKLAEELKNVRFDEESFLSFIGRCDGRF